MFLKPRVQDLEATREILGVFGEISGLSVNYSKSLAIVIKGEPQDSLIVKHVLQCDLGKFPCKYLGLQLSPIQLTKGQWQPMLDRVINFLPAWQRFFLDRPGRLILIKAVVMARPIHQLLIAEAPVWLLEQVNRWARAFF
jgi:hypothetical protein